MENIYNLGGSSVLFAELIHRECNNCIVYIHVHA